MEGNNEPRDAETRRHGDSQMQREDESVFISVFPRLRVPVSRS